MVCAGLAATQYMDVLDLVVAGRGRNRAGTVGFRRNLLDRRRPLR